jgi:hypothetical protein
MAVVIVLELAEPPSPQTLVLGKLGKSKDPIGLDLCDMSINNGHSSAHLRHKFDKLARTVEVVKEAATEHSIEVAVVTKIVADRHARKPN